MAVDTGDEQHCLQLQVSCRNRTSNSTSSFPSQVSAFISHWVLQALRSLTCQCNFLRSAPPTNIRRNPTATSIEQRSAQTRSSPAKYPAACTPALVPTAAIVPLLHRSLSRNLFISCASSNLHCTSTMPPDQPVPALDSATLIIRQSLKEKPASNCVESRPLSDYCSLSEGSISDQRGSSSCSTGDANSSISLATEEGECGRSRDTISTCHCTVGGNTGYTDIGSCHDLKNRLPESTGSTPAVLSVFTTPNTKMCDVQLMKEKFSKLLLGEDMSGGTKGVPTALAISNAITNLSASVFGELWRLEPLPAECTHMWRKELEWLLCAAEHIVELVPSWQTLPDGSKVEVMISKPRSDIHINLPALRNLDAMLLNCLESFRETEFWYAGSNYDDECSMGKHISLPPARESQDFCSRSRQQERRWLPIARVSVNGLSIQARKALEHERECVKQILKAARAINTQILSEIEVPAVYWESLPKSGKTSLGGTIYRQMLSEYFCPEALLSELDLSTEHNVMELVNRIEAAIHIWQWKKMKRPSTQKNHGDVAHLQSPAEKDACITDRRDVLAGRAQVLLWCLKGKFPGLPQSLLDLAKIQYNRDVGQSILESYSRVTESLAFNIMACIDEVVYVDTLVKGASSEQQDIKSPSHSLSGQTTGAAVAGTTPFVTPIATPASSPCSSP